ncbi:DUF3265 domain-containing protein [Vibrio parahaemolyticus]|nr:DUF3265 domain-containing protein [Vibrio parahaemolyticus]
MIRNAWHFYYTLVLVVLVVLVVKVVKVVCGSFGIALLTP